MIIKGNGGRFIVHTDDNCDYTITALEDKIGNPSAVSIKMYSWWAIEFALNLIKMVKPRIDDIAKIEEFIKNVRTEQEAADERWRNLRG